MKRILALFLAALIAVMPLCACGKDKAEQPEEQEKKETSESLDLEAIYQSIIAAQPETEKEKLVLFAESDPNIINSLYAGLADIKLNQQVLYMAPVVGYACEIMLVEAADEADVPRIAEVFQNRVNIGVMSTGDADNGEVWSRNAKVQTSGRYAAMMVLPDGCAVPESIFE